MLSASIYTDSASANRLCTRYSVNIRVVRAVCLLQDGEGPIVEPLGLLMAAHRAIERSEVIDEHGDLRAIGNKSLFRNA
jgi:hypothetical protein